ncbi:MAG: zinc-ribbon domain-containing protein [Desulfamplus sp.]|nr:zinc-ribbon domain-containing protein [Desulfamplus sp.]
MIDVSCESCGKKYRLDSKLIKSSNAKFTCKSCGHVNLLDKYITKATPDSHTKAAPVSHIKAAPVSQVPPAETRQTMGSDDLKVTWANSLQVKVNAVLISLILVIMSTFMVINYVTEKDKMEAQKQKMEDELKTSSVNVAKRLSVYLVEAFWSLDDEILSESLKSEMMDKNIFAINLVDRSGTKIYLGYSRGDDWQLIENHQSINEQGTVSSTEKIERDGSSIGSVQVYLTSRFVDAQVKLIEERFNQSMYQLLITSILLLSAVALAVYLVLGRMILAPIARLTHAANRISLGDLELEIPIESKDEIGVLAGAFARMKVSMAFAIKQLRKR